MQLIHQKSFFFINLDKNEDLLTGIATGILV